jgi:chemotaxis signal transduction protein
MTEAAGLQVVAFSLGAARFAMPAAEVVALRPFADGDAPAIEDLLGLPRRPQPAAHLLVLRVAGVERAVAVPGAVSLETLAVAAIHPLPPLVAARTRIAGLAALATDDAGVVMVIDPGRLTVA